MNILQTLAAIQQATNAARARLNDKTISTQVKAGKVQVTRVTYDASGKSTVAPLTGFMESADAISYLDSMK